MQVILCLVLPVDPGGQEDSLEKMIWRMRLVWSLELLRPGQNVEKGGGLIQLCSAEVRYS